MHLWLCLPLLIRFCLTPLPISAWIREKEACEYLNNGLPGWMTSYLHACPQRLRLCPTLPWLPPLKAAKGNNSCRPLPGWVFLRYSCIINYWVGVSQFPWLLSTGLHNIKVYRSRAPGALLPDTPPACHSAPDPGSSRPHQPRFVSSILSTRCLERKTTVSLKKDQLDRRDGADSNIWQLCGWGRGPGAMK